MKKYLFLFSFVFCLMSFSAVPEGFYLVTSGTVSGKENCARFDFTAGVYYYIVIDVSGGGLGLVYSQNPYDF
ncbi:MAG: hypothetical protein PHS65_04055, partial [Arcobacteraceae bacterium]|nr:hypothetical protein [Arcobacteraceae bacterium]